MAFQKCLIKAAIHAFIFANYIETKMCEVFANIIGWLEGHFSVKLVVASTFAEQGYIRSQIVFCFSAFMWKSFVQCLECLKFKVMLWNFFVAKGFVFVSVQINLQTVYDFSSFLSKLPKGICTIEITQRYSFRMIMSATCIFE